ncbi:GDP-L-fucose synthase [Stappia sp. BW2]|uniref:GDP-L-fucose synthase family protein n=1 Tax=Stappia sp. BW2 TaxID=2592622 RepID=UPI0011DE6B00|nr:GDP-L-fucose synthase [Stappia sp. BW2]TYC79824.1 GDP-L-fucose synthase [Stappia sp. BW2]
MTGTSETGQALETPFDLAGKRVFVAGHTGMVGSAIVRRLMSEDCEILTVPSRELDLRRQADVENWMSEMRPNVVFLAAARVGGILANSTRPAEFLFDNLMIESNVIHSAYQSPVDKLVFLGSTCIYPKMTSQPIREESLLSGPLEPTNQWYALAKISGIKLCEAYRLQYGCDFISAQPTNLYGPGDNYDLQSSHVLPALLRKAHEAKTSGRDFLEVWGDGSPLREFLHVDDLADAVVFLAKRYSDPMPVNVGTGKEISIRQLAELICDIVGFEGELAFDASKPNGTPRKLTDTSRLTALGWAECRSLAYGLRETYRDAFLENSCGVRTS